MKKLTLFLVTFIVLSCSSDENNDVISPDQIVGKWQVTGGFNYQDKPQILGVCELLETFQFFENSTLTIKEYEGTNCQRIYSGNVNYSISNNVLTYINPTGGFKGGEFKRKFNIKTLNSTNLKIEIFYENDEEGSEGIIPENERWSYIFIKIK